MGVSKDDAAIAAGVALLLFGGRKALASSSSKAPASAADDGAALVKRANQERARAWTLAFTDGGGAPDVAAALARWIGIESSGDALNKSRLNERGLMQAGPQTVAEGGLTQQEWDALTNPATSKAAQAGLAVKYVAWLWSRAQRYIDAPPTDDIDQIWYAKLYHQWPVDVRDGELHGEALSMARELATRWASDAKRMHRLRAANVVAWGRPEP